MKIAHKRSYEALRTVGQLFIDGKPYGSTIEDIGRPYGVKVAKETCIPEGSYRVTITQSQRFGRPMMLLYTNPLDKSVDMGGIKFTGIRVHKGTKTEHTEGCVLYQGDLAELQSLVDAAFQRGEQVTWDIERV